MHQSFTWAADTRLFYGTNGGDREATGVPAAFQFTQKLMRKSQAGQTQSVQLCLKVHILFLTQIKVSRIVAKTFFSLRMALPSIRMCKLLIWLLQILLKSFVVSVLCFFTLFRHGGELHSDIRMLFDGGDNWEDLDGTRFDSLQTWRQETAETNTREARNRTAWTYNSRCATCSHES